VAGLSGDVLHVTIPAGTQSGTALRVKGKGMPKVGTKGKGDLFVVVEARTPTDLTERERTLLQALAALQHMRSPDDALDM
jgi:DnaJ-class molecular chaperone